MDARAHWEAVARNVKVEILEQPASNRLRFRYAVEGRGAGALVGENTTKDTRSFPSIKIHGYQVSQAFIAKSYTCRDFRPKLSLS